MNETRLGNLSLCIFFLNLPFEKNKLSLRPRLIKSKRLQILFINAIFLFSFPFLINRGGSALTNYGSVEKKRKYTESLLIKIF